MIVENCVRKLTKIKFTSINFGQVVPYGIDAMVFIKSGTIFKCAEAKKFREIELFHDFFVTLTYVLL